MMTCPGGAAFAVQRGPALDQRASPQLPRGAAYEYRYMTEFQSHEPEFDYLKSLEIEEKINKVRWCRSSNNTRMLLSTNDKTVKLWKVRVAGGTEAERRGRVARRARPHGVASATRPIALDPPCAAGVREEGRDARQLQPGGARAARGAGPQGQRARQQPAPLGAARAKGAPPPHPLLSDGGSTGATNQSPTGLRTPPTTAPPNACR